MTKLEKLIAMGGKEWIKGAYHRVYFNYKQIVDIIGLELSYYKTGNISCASVNGEQISNCEARRLVAAANEGIYYDVNADKFGCKFPSNRTDYIIDLINQKLEA